MKNSSGTKDGPWTETILVFLIPIEGKKLAVRAFAWPIIEGKTRDIWIYDDPAHNYGRMIFEATFNQSKLRWEVMLPNINEWFKT